MPKNPTGRRSKKEGKVKSAIGGGESKREYIESDSGAALTDASVIKLEDFEPVKSTASSEIAKQIGIVQRSLDIATARKTENYDRVDKYVKHLNTKPETKEEAVKGLEEAKIMLEDINMTPARKEIVMDGLNYAIDAVKDGRGPLGTSIENIVQDVNNVRFVGSRAPNEGLFSSPLDALGRKLESYGKFDKDGNWVIEGYKSPYRPTGYDKINELQKIEDIRLHGEIVYASPKEAGGSKLQQYQLVQDDKGEFHRIPDDLHYITYKDTKGKEKVLQIIKVNGLYEIEPTADFEHGNIGKIVSIHGLPKFTKSTIDIRLQQGQILNKAYTLGKDMTKVETLEALYNIRDELKAYNKEHKKELRQVVGDDVTSTKTLKEIYYQTEKLYGIENEYLREKLEMLDKAKDIKLGNLIPQSERTLDELIYAVETDKLKDIEKLGIKAAIFEQPNYNPKQVLSIHSTRDDDKKLYQMLVKNLMDEYEMITGSRVLSKEDMEILQISRDDIISADDLSSKERYLSTLKTREQGVMKLLKDGKITEQEAVYMISSYQDRAKKVKKFDKPNEGVLKSIEENGELNMWYGGEDRIGGILHMKRYESLHKRAEMLTKRIAKDRKKAKETMAPDEALRQEVAEEQKDLITQLKREGKIGGRRFEKSPYNMDKIPTSDELELANIYKKSSVAQTGQGNKTAFFEAFSKLANDYSAKRISRDEFLKGQANLRDMETALMTPPALSDTDIKGILGNKQDTFTFREFKKDISKATADFASGKLTIKEYNAEVEKAKARANYDISTFNPKMLFQRVDFSKSNKKGNFEELQAGSSMDIISLIENYFPTKGLKSEEVPPSPIGKTPGEITRAPGKRRREWEIGYQAIKEGAPYTRFEYGSIINTDALIRANESDIKAINTFLNKGKITDKSLNALERDLINSASHYIGTDGKPITQLVYTGQGDKVTEVVIPRIKGVTKKEPGQLDQYRDIVELAGKMKDEGKSDDEIKTELIKQFNGIQNTLINKKILPEAANITLQKNKDGLLQAYKGKPEFIKSLDEIKTVQKEPTMKDVEEIKQDMKRLNDDLDKITFGEDKTINKLGNVMKGVVKSVMRGEFDLTKVEDSAVQQQKVNQVIRNGKVVNKVADEYHDGMGNLKNFNENRQPSVFYGNKHTEGPADITARDVVKFTELGKTDLNLFNDELFDKKLSVSGQAREHWELLRKERIPSYLQGVSGLQKAIDTLNANIKYLPKTKKTDKIQTRSELSKIQEQKARENLLNIVNKAEYKEFIKEVYDYFNTVTPSALKDIPKPPSSILKAVNDPFWGKIIKTPTFMKRENSVIPGSYSESEIKDATKFHQDLNKNLDKISFRNVSDEPKRLTPSKTMTDLKSTEEKIKALSTLKEKINTYIKENGEINKDHPLVQEYRSILGETGFAKEASYVITEPDFNAKGDSVEQMYPRPSNVPARIIFDDKLNRVPTVFMRDMEEEVVSHELQQFLNVKTNKISKPLREYLTVNPDTYESKESTAFKPSYKKRIRYFYGRASPEGRKQIEEMTKQLDEKFNTKLFTEPVRTFEIKPYIETFTPKYTTQQRIIQEGITKDTIDEIKRQIDNFELNPKDVEDLFRGSHLVQSEGLLRDVLERRQITKDINKSLDLDTVEGKVLERKLSTKVYDAQRDMLIDMDAQVEGIKRKLGLQDKTDAEIIKLINKKELPTKMENDTLKYAKEVQTEFDKRTKDVLSGDDDDANTMIIQSVINKNPAYKEAFEYWQKNNMQSDFFDMLFNGKTDDAKKLRDIIYKHNETTKGLMDEYEYKAYQKLGGDKTKEDVTIMDVKALKLYTALKRYSERKGTPEPLQKTAENWFESNKFKKGGKMTKAQSRQFMKDVYNMTDSDIEDLEKSNKNLYEEQPWLKGFANNIRFDTGEEAWKDRLGDRGVIGESDQGIGTHNEAIDVGEPVAGSRKGKMYRKWPSASEIASNIIPSAFNKRADETKGNRQKAMKLLAGDESQIPVPNNLNDAAKHPLVNLQTLLTGTILPKDAKKNVFKYLNQWNGKMGYSETGQPNQNRIYGFHGKPRNDIQDPKAIIKAYDTLNYIVKDMVSKTIDAADKYGNGSHEVKEMQKEITRIFPDIKFSREQIVRIQEAREIENALLKRFGWKDGNSATDKLMKAIYGKVTTKELYKYEQKEKSRKRQTKKDTKFSNIAKLKSEVLSGKNIDESLITVFGESQNVQKHLKNKQVQALIKAPKKIYKTQRIMESTKLESPRRYIESEFKNDAERQSAYYNRSMTYNQHEKLALNTLSKFFAQPMETSHRKGPDSNAPSPTDVDIIGTFVMRALKKNPSLTVDDFPYLDMVLVNRVRSQKKGVGLAASKKLERNKWMEAMKTSGYADHILQLELNQLNAPTSGYKTREHPLYGSVKDYDYVPTNRLVFGSGGIPLRATPRETRGKLGTIDSFESFAYNTKEYNKDDTKIINKIKELAKEGDVNSVNKLVKTLSDEGFGVYVNGVKTWIDALQQQTHKGILGWGQFKEKPYKDDLEQFMYGKYGLGKTEQPTITEPKLQDIQKLSTKQYESKFDTTTRDAIDFMISRGVDIKKLSDYDPDTPEIRNVLSEVFQTNGQTKNNRAAIIERITTSDKYMEYGIKKSIEYSTNLEILKRAAKSKPETRKSTELKDETGKPYKKPAPENTRERRVKTVVESNIDKGLGKINMASNGNAETIVRLLSVIRKGTQSYSFKGVQESFKNDVIRNRSVEKITSKLGDGNESEMEINLSKYIKSAGGKDLLHDMIYYGLNNKIPETPSVSKKVSENMKVLKSATENINKPVKFNGIMYRNANELAGKIRSMIIQGRLDDLGISKYEAQLILANLRK